MWIKFFFVLTAVSMLAAPCRAEDSVAICKNQYNDQKQSLLHEVTRLEDTYAGYRWTEAKIRNLYLEYIGPARRAMHDPFSKTKRQAATDKEKQLFYRLKEYEEESSDRSNAIHRNLNALQAVNIDIGLICGEFDYDNCIQQAFVELFDYLEDVKKNFTEIFERERDFRKIIADSVAGRTGFYSEDAIASADTAQELYWKYEADKEHIWYEDDRRMRNHFHFITEMLTRNFKGDSCCYQCGAEREE